MIFLFLVEKLHRAVQQHMDIDSFIGIAVGSVRRVFRVTTEFHLASLSEFLTPFRFPVRPGTAQIAIAHVLNFVGSFHAVIKTTRP